MTLRRTALKRTPAKTRSPRPRKCRNPDCRERFTPRQPLQTWCSPACGVIVARAAQRKQQRRQDTATRESLKTASDWTVRADREFSAFIRERDYSDPCISCGRPPGDNGALTGGTWDAGHYRSRGANPELRYDEDNCHKQCKRCNRDLSGNVANYRIRLRQKIGDERLDILEGPHPLPRYRIEDLRSIRDHYRREARRLKKDRETRGSVTA